MVSCETSRERAAPEELPDSPTNIALNFLAAMASSEDSDAMQRLICARSIIMMAKKMLDQHQIDGSPKMFLTAFLVHRFPTCLFGAEPTHDEKEIVRTASNVHGSILSGNLAWAFAEYSEKFKVWQEADRPRLLDALAARYADMNNALLSAKIAGDDANVLRKSIQDHQEQIRQKIEKIGGKTAVAELESYCRPQSPLLSITEKFEEFTAIPVAAIVHELCMNRHFELLHLLNQYGNGVARSRDLRQECFWSTEEGLLELIAFLRQHLLPIVPKGTQRELAIHLDEERVRVAMEQKTLFSVEYACQVAVKVMEGSCAPLRDQEVSNLKQALSAGVPIGHVVNELIGCVELMRLDYISYELIQQRPLLLESVVPYEQKYFQSVEFVKAQQMYSEHPDWSEWIFLKDFEEIESAQFDRQRARLWREALETIVLHASAKLLKGTPVGLESGVSVLLKKRIQAAVKEAVQSGAARSKDRLVRDGFLPQQAIRLHDLITEMAHFFRLHLAIHQNRYVRHNQK